MTQSMHKRFLMYSALAAFLAVALGAFAAVKRELGL